MSGPIEQESANIIPPLVNVAAAAGVPEQANQFAQDVTTSSSEINLATFLTAWDKGHFLTLHADGGDVYYAFHRVTGGSIDTTVRTAKAVTICQRIPSGQDRSVRLPPIDQQANPYQFLLVRCASGTAVIRGYVSSIGQMEDIRALQPRLP